MSKTQTSTSSNVGIFQIAILILSILVLAALAADTLCEFPAAIHNLIQLVDASVCMVLLVDFFVRLSRAESKWAFMKWGWIDLIASIPNLDLLRWGRLVRILRIIRLLRAIRSIHRVVSIIFQNKLQGGAISLGLVAFLLIAFSSFSILICERSQDANIKSAEDAIWWSISTMTTVGYGDEFPVTTEGRVVGIVLMICGVGLFAGLSGMVASIFLGVSDRQVIGLEDIMLQITQMQAKMDVINARLKSGTEDSGGRR